MRLTYYANTFVFKKKFVTATAKEFLTPLSEIKKEWGGLGIFGLNCVIEETIINHTKRKISSKYEFYLNKNAKYRVFLRITLV